MAGIPAQNPHPPAVTVLAELSPFLTVFGLDDGLGESALLAPSCHPPLSRKSHLDGVVARSVELSVLPTPRSSHPSLCN